MRQNHMPEVNSDKRRIIMEIAIFFIITYGISLLFGIPLIFKEYMKPEAMTFFMMVLPASGVAIAKVYKNKENDKNLIFHYIIICNFCLYLCLVILRVLGILSDNVLLSIMAILTFLISPLIICYTCIEGKELYPFKNIEKVILPIFIFVLMNVISKCIMLYGKSVDYVNLVMYIFLIIPSFILQSIYFFGEEYGWRGFLQEKMQKKFGKRKGIILLGIIWELWHIPLWFTYYNVDSLGILLRLIYVIGMAIFLGYIYMRTNNVWACVLVHLFNNIMPDNNLTNMSLNLNSSTLNSHVILGYLIFSIFLSLFIFAKEYK
ncbi:CPBP family intramembrane glutamic endopeptidase [Clostridioides difficile]